jgi:two-component system sensor histidine kinase PilS (NtrC family)
VALRCRIKADTQYPYLDIQDSGPGIATEHLEQIFEPFFTTYAKGTGLGLYIARELCEANQALLTLHDNSMNGCCFRIDFAHPQRQHITVP